MQHKTDCGIKYRYTSEIGITCSQNYQLFDRLFGHSATSKLESMLLLEQAKKKRNHSLKLVF
jgi:hypothetical protein